MSYPITVFRRASRERAFQMLANDALFESKNGIILRLLIDDLANDLTRAETQLEILTSEVLRLQHALTTVDVSRLTP